MGGGPHIRMSTSLAGGGRCSFIMSAVTNPLLYFHPEQGDREIFKGIVTPEQFNCQIMKVITYYYYLWRYSYDLVQCHGSRFVNHKCFCVINLGSKCVLYLLRVCPVCTTDWVYQGDLYKLHPALFVTVCPSRSVEVQHKEKLVLMRIGWSSVGGMLSGGLKPRH